MPDYHPQKAYHQRMTEKGFVKVSCWVPEDERETIAEVARSMRDAEMQEQKQEQLKKVRSVISAAKQKIEG